MTKNEERGSYGLRVFILTLALSLIMGGSAALAAGPADDIKSLINEVQAILDNPALQAPDQRARKIDLVEQAAARHFDYREMAQRSLGETWDTLNQGQQNEFVKNFSGLLKASFACRLDGFTKAGVTYQPEILKSDHAEVPIIILRPNDKIPVSFRMLKEPQGWKIYDLLIEGVSLADNYRGQFARIIQGGSFQDLLKVLQARMAEECKP
ncbi:MAG: ABC transporter substrate-binding protein [Deltaproteobacteria bacterium]|nr:ABC transporter substrate-binding protein [Deltaproteobacteria bacterium]